MFKALVRDNLVTCCKRIKIVHDVRLSKRKVQSTEMCVCVLYIYMCVSQNRNNRAKPQASHGLATMSCSCWHQGLWKGMPWHVHLLTLCFTKICRRLGTEMFQELLECWVPGGSAVAVCQSMTGNMHRWPRNSHPQLWSKNSQKPLPSWIM